MRRDDRTIATHELTLTLISHDRFASLFFLFWGIMPNSELIFDIEVLSFK
jgi:hypothetical protein